MNVNTSRNQVIIPWGPGADVAPQDLKFEAKARVLMKNTDRVANHHIENPDGYRSDFSGDLDPDPSRILRTSTRNGVQYVLEVKTDGADTPKPTSLNLLSTSDDSYQESATWKNGQIVSLTYKEGGATTELRVNDNGTLTFTETEPPKEETLLT